MPVSYSYEYKSSSSTTTPQGTASRTVHTTPQGTTVTASQQPSDGQPSSRSEFYPAGGSSNAGNSQGRIEDVSNISEAEAERRYLEAMEDEYAKREGGA
ncbi:hypothetical protein AA313_de0208414 [Arthrobotrys entomopaga]|nr:hypothetical protein AA313_de0208414 [Arthrobotrys entomopaga]